MPPIVGLAEVSCEVPLTRLIPLVLRLLDAVLTVAARLKGGGGAGGGSGGC